MWRLTRRLDTKVVYRRYASLFFVCGIGSEDNELITLEIVHRYVEVLDRYFGNVSLLVLLVWKRCNADCIGDQVCELDLYVLMGRAFVGNA